MALTTARISSSRGRPPGLGGGIKSLIRSHSASVRSVGYGLAVIPPVYRTDATYGRLFKQPLRQMPETPDVGSRRRETTTRPRCPIPVQLRGSPRQKGYLTVL